MELVNVEEIDKAIGNVNHCDVDDAGVDNAGVDAATGATPSNKPLAQNIRVENEKNVTKTDILAEADAIWQECQETFKKIKGQAAAKSKHNTTPSRRTLNNKNTVLELSKQDEQLLDDLLGEKQKSHREFTQAYPTVLRHMIQDMSYSHQAFQKYLEMVEKRPWSNDEERLDSYTTYATLLKRSYNNRVSQSEISAFRTQYRLSLQKEHDEFVAKVKDCESKQKANEDRLASEKTNDLIRTFRRIAARNDMDMAKVEAVIQMVRDDKLSNNQLETMIYEIRRIEIGDSTPEDIIREREKARETAIENREYTQKLMPDNVAQEMRDQLEENITKSQQTAQKLKI